MMKLKKYGKTNKGFTLLETLLALYIISITMLLLTSSLGILKQMNKDHRYSDDAIAIHQIRILLATSKNIQILENELSFDLQSDTFYLQFDRNRLIKRKGYEIYLEDVEELHFYEEGECFGVEWKRNKSSDSAILCCS